MTDTLTEGGTLLATEDPRVFRVRALPWGVAGRTNLGPLAWAKGTITVPRDESILMANISHDREQVVGRIFDVEQNDDALDLKVRVADTDEGDFLLAEVAAGRLTKFSVEVKKVVHRAGQALGGTLFGGAFTSTPAYEGATLLAEEAPQQEQNLTWADVNKILGEAGQFVQTEKGKWIFQPAEKTPESAPAEEDKPDEGTEKKENEMGASTPNSTMEASASSAPTPRTSIRALAEALAAAGPARRDETLLANLAEKGGETLFAALADVKYDYTGSAGVAIIQPQYAGELWKGRTYQRRYIPLLANAPLTSLKEVGWHWTTKPTVAKWLGNKTDVPSNTPATAPDTWQAGRWAGAHDHAREFIDFDSPDYWESYLKAMTESYARLTDIDALDQIIAGATTVSAGSVTGLTTAGQKATAAIVDGALATLVKDVPSYAIVGADVYRSLILQTSQNVVGTLSLALGLEDGSLDTFRIVPTDRATLAGKVLVGTRSAAVFKELPGSPIRVDAVDLARGGVDTGFFGYTGVKIDEPLGISVVTVAP